MGGIADKPASLLPANQVSCFNHTGHTSVAAHDVKVLVELEMDGQHVDGGSALTD